MKSCYITLLSSFLAVGAACSGSSSNHAALSPASPDGGAETNSLPSDLPTRGDIADVMDPLLEQGYVKSAVVGYVDATGQVAYGYGTTNSNSVPDGNSIYESGSVTKTFTSLWLATQLANGLKLEDPVSAHLPKGMVVPSRNGKTITLGMLSTHTSGLPRLPTNLAPKDPSDPYADYSVSDLYAFLASYSLKVDPGSSFEYSNIGAGLLGHVLTLHGGGDSYEANISRVIGEPLGLVDTATTLSSSQRERLVSGHDGDLNPAHPWTATNAIEGAGMLHSTVNDLLRLLSAEIGLSGDKLASAIAQTQKEYAKDSLGRAQGLGWVIESKDEFWHNGQTGGFASFIIFDPASKRGVVVLADTACQYTDYVGIALFRRFKGKTASLKLPPHVALTDAELDAFVGRYSLDHESLIIARKDHALLATGLLSTPVRLYPTSASTFAMRRLSGSITFSTKSITVSLDGSAPMTGPKQ